MPTIQNVVKNEICVGCGACSVVTNGAISVHKGEYGSFVADLTNVEPALLETGSRVCPFADEAPDEDTVADRVINEAPLSDPRVGKYRFIHAGRVASDDYLNDSSSGGLTSWLVGKLLENGLVDGVIHVGRTGEDLFSYSVSRTPDQLRAKRKSAYYSTTLSEVLTEIRGDGLRYALVGVPCFVKAARLVCLEDATLSEQLKFFVGLVCGHLKSAAFAEFLAWQCGVAPAEVGAVDFRVKARGRDAGRYDFGVLKKGAVEWVTRPTYELMGGNWGHGMFQLNACNYCDDIFAETADVVLGDAWLPEYRADWRGTNIVVTRNATIDSILEGGRLSGEIVLDPLTIDRASESQGGNFRHRRDGLSVRLADDMRAGKWVPLKRIAPGSVRLSGQRKALVRQRRRISDTSHRMLADAKALHKLGHFVSGIQPLVEKYERIARGSLAERVRARLGRMFQRVKELTVRKNE